MTFSRRTFLIVAASSLVACQTRDATFRDGLKYEVKAGDSLSSIARHHNIMVHSIIDANGLTSRNLKTGQKLFLPHAIPPDPNAHALPNGVRIGAGAITYQIVSRKEWNAPSPRSNFDPMNGINRITLHHTAEQAGVSGRSDLEIIQSIHKHHTRNRGYADIGYHFLIGRDGKVYEGRSVTMQGAHSGGDNNKHNLGISLIGNFMHHQPNSLQLKTLKSFLHNQQLKYHVSNQRILAHRDLKVTDCPGDAFYNWIQEYKRDHKK